MIKTLRQLVVKGMYEDTGLVVVDTDNSHKKPPYPFYSFKFMTLRQNVGEDGVESRHFEPSLNPNFKHDYIEEITFQPKVIMSFNAYADDIVACQEWAYKAWEWFRFQSRQLFAENNIKVVIVGNMTDRSIYIADYYEYRVGFDVEFRIVHRIENRTETIEHYKFNQKKTRRGVDL